MAFQGKYMNHEHRGLYFLSYSHTLTVLKNKVIARKEGRVKKHKDSKDF